MSIISQETWDNMPENEKKKICKEYLSDKKFDDDRYFEGSRDMLEELFGKENLQPKIRTWEDYQEMNEDSNFFMRINDNLELPDKVYSKCIATLKIAKLIELGYGGMVGKEDKQSDDGYYVIYPVVGYGELQVVWSINTNIVGRDFIAFHTLQQAKEFMSYPENVKLIEQYYML